MQREKWLWMQQNTNSCCSSHLVTSGHNCTDWTQLTFSLQIFMYFCKASILIIFTAVTSFRNTTAETGTQLWITSHPICALVCSVCLATSWSWKLQPKLTSQLSFRSNTHIKTKQLLIVSSSSLDNTLVEIQAVETFLFIRADVKKELKIRNRKVSILLIHNRVALVGSHLYWSMKEVKHLRSVSSFQQTALSIAAHLEVSTEFQMQNHRTYLGLCTLAIQAC